MRFFSKALTHARRSLGYKSARSFFAILSERGVEFDYSYYTRIENGQALPSPKVISALVGHFPEPAMRESLIKAYCAEQFPVFSHLFSSIETSEVPYEIKASNSAQDSPSTLKKQRYLSPLQTKVVSSTKAHYFAYLVVTLARRSLTLIELSKCIGESEEIIKKCVLELMKVKVFSKDQDQIDSFVKESHFPKRADFPSLAKNYDQLDIWDLEFSEKVGFDLSRRKTYLRRISPRSLPVILQMTDALIKVLEISDDSNDERNSLVLSFSNKINIGHLPG